MAADINDPVWSDAIAWFIRLREDRPEDWDAFVLWLEQDPANSEAYDAIALADHDMAVVAEQMPRPEPHAVNDDDVGRGPLIGRRGWLAGGGALAAALVVAGIVGPGLLKDMTYDVVTRAGERRVVVLPGGDRIAMNGATRITLDRRTPRFASLHEGEAAFTIRHDPIAPFTLELGEDRVLDVGTLFNVVREPAGQTIEVAEGAVLYNPKREAITLAAGETLDDRVGASRIRIGRKDPETIASWRRGRLDYRGQPLSAVAADLARNLGTRVNVDPAIAMRPFSGTIVIDPNADRMFSRLGAVLDVDAVRNGTNWTLRPRKRAAR